MAAAANSLTSLLKRNLATMPSRLEGEVVNVPIFIDTTISGQALTNAAYKILTISAPTIVLGGYLVVHTVEGAAETITIGDTSSATYWLGATSLNATGATVFSGAGKYYAAADEVQITPSAAQGTSKFWVIVRLLPLVAS